MKKKLPALLCALALILSLAGCVISTPDTVGTIGDMEITSGLYLLAQYNAYQSAANLASSDQDAANVKSFLKETITTDPDSGETAPSATTSPTRPRRIWNCTPPWSPASTNWAASSPRPRSLRPTATLRS